MRYWDLEEWILNGLIAIIIGTVVFFISDGAFSQKNQFNGKIHEMTFVHGNQTTTVGMAFTGKGAAPVIATSGHPDEWSMIVLAGDTYIKVKCSANQYYHHEIGDAVKISQHVGRFTGILWNTELEN